MHIKKGLIESCIAQNRAAQKELYQLLLPYLRAIARRYLRDNSYVKDVLQESFLKIFRSISKYNFDKAPLEQWAGRITINCAINYNNRVIGIPKEEFLLDAHEPKIMPKVFKNLSNENLLFVLKQMPNGYFEVFNLSVIDGYSHDEIAKMLNISASLSRKRLSRARSWLKKIFEEKPEWISKFNFSSFYLN